VCLCIFDVNECARISAHIIDTISLFREVKVSMTSNQRARLGTEYDLRIREGTICVCVFTACALSVRVPVYSRGRSIACGW
jgi:hypothetical protein